MCSNEKTCDFFCKVENKWKIVQLSKKVACTCAHINKKLFMLEEELIENILKVNQQQHWNMTVQTITKPVILLSNLLKKIYSKIQLWKSLIK